MKSAAQSRLLRFAVSPYGLAAISYAIFLCACLVPPSTYSHYMSEPDLMFLDPASILVYSLGVAAFVGGVWLVSWLFPTAFVERKISTKILPLSFLLGPLILAISVAVVATINLLRSYPLILMYLVARRGDDIKDTMVMDATGYYGLVPHALTAITWWAYWRYSELDLTGGRRLIVKTALAVAVIVSVVSCFVTMNRSIAMIAICGLAILFLARRAFSLRVGNRFVLKTALAVGIGIPLLFMAFTFMRGTDSLDVQINAFLGYTIASYNRMAAMLGGRLRLPSSGYGLGLGGFIVTSRLLHVRTFLDIPDPANLFGGAFLAVSQAGLDGRLVWEGAFADIFADIGWLYVPFVFSYGLLYGMIWNWFKRGKTAAVILYPWCGFCVFFWLGGNYLFGGPLEALLPLSVFLTFYETVLVRKTRTASSAEIATINGLSAKSAGH